MLASPEPSDAAEPPRPRVPILALLFWTLFAFAIPWCVQLLDVTDVLAFPLGFFMVAQGSLIAFLVIAVLSARRQDRLVGSGTKDR